MSEAKIVIHKEYCPGNHICPVIRACPTGALKQTGYACPEIDYSKCINCGRCIFYCATGAISRE